MYKCLEDKDVRFNLVVVKILYEGGEIRLLINANEASKLGRIFDKD